MLVVASLVAFGLLLFFGLLHLTTNARAQGPQMSWTNLSPTTNYYLYLPIQQRECCHWWSRTYYMDTVNETSLYDLGDQECRRTPTDGISTVVVLDFGPPVRIGSDYGTQLFHTGVRVTTQQIYSATVQYLRGFHFCKIDLNDMNYHLTLSVGTNNNAGLGGLTLSHGTAWAQLINDVNDWISSSPSWAEWLTARGGIDIELSAPFAPPLTTRTWITGYVDTYRGESLYYDYGSCEDCPTTVGAQCPSMHQGWTCEDVWYVAWGARPALPLPLTYNNQGINAQQWRWLSWYSWWYHNHRMSIKGSFTQWQICLIRPQLQGCAGADQPPWVGWAQLFDTLNAYTMTAETEQELQWATDITRTWQSMSNN